MEKDFIFNETTDVLHEQNHLDELVQHAEEQQRIIANEAVLAVSTDPVIMANGHRHDLNQPADQHGLDIYYDQLKKAAEINQEQRLEQAQNNIDEIQVDRQSSGLYEVGKCVITINRAQQ